MAITLTALEPFGDIIVSKIHVSFEDWDKFLDITCKYPAIYEVKNAGDMYLGGEGLDSEDSYNLARNIFAWMTEVEVISVFSERISHYGLNRFQFYRLITFIEKSGGFTVTGYLQDA